LSSDNARLALEELARRAKAKEAAKPIVQRLRDELFAEQQAFVDDKSRNKAVLGTRRAGKTSIWIRYTTIECLEKDRVLIRIWSMSRLRAKQLLWTEFDYLHKKYGIVTERNETELSIRFENGSEIRLLGADKDKEAQKKRGDKTWMEIVLEAQSFGPFLRTLVEDVAEPCLFDLRGTFCMEGTPGPLCTGYWYEVSGRNDTEKRWTSIGGDLGVGRGWSCHRITLFDNPHLPHAKEELARLKKARNWADDNPTYVREYLGRWVNDLTALYYAFDETRNLYQPGEVTPKGPGWTHVLGWDLGSRDDMALVLWGWHENDPIIYEAESWKKSGALAAEVMEQIDRWEAQGYNIVKKVADTGGGGRMYVEEVMSRYSHVFEAAKKSEKYEHVRLLNDDLRVGRIKLKSGSPYHMEIRALPRDPDWPDPDKPEKPPTEHPGYPNHCCFVAGTLVLTSRGEIPVETVRVGDLVLGRSGWERVAFTWDNGTKEIITRAGLTGTPDHKIWTENRGWARLDSLLDNDVLLYACEKLSKHLAPSGTGTRNLTAGQTGRTLEDTNEASPYTCTDTCGSKLTGQFPKSTIFTTKTRTQATILWRIWNWLLGLLTLVSTCGIGTRAPRKCLSNALWPHALPHQSGTHPQKVEPGTRNMGSVSPQTRHFTPVSVRFVEQILSQKHLQPGCAVPNVEPRTEETAARTTSNLCARSATSDLLKTDSKFLSSARGAATVYTITATGPIGEYVANGVLVKNCDSALYGYRAAQHYLSTAKPTKIRRGTPEYFNKVIADEIHNLDLPPDAWWETRGQDHDVE